MGAWTNPQKCWRVFKWGNPIFENDLCIEPSAGNGAFIEGIKSIFKNYKCYDLKPEHTEIIEQDYLEFDLTYPCV